MGGQYDGRTDGSAFHAPGATSVSEPHVLESILADVLVPHEGAASQLRMRMPFSERSGSIRTISMHIINWC